MEETKFSFASDCQLEIASVVVMGMCPVLLLTLELPMMKNHSGPALGMLPQTMGVHICMCHVEFKGFVSWCPSFLLTLALFPTPCVQASLSPKSRDLMNLGIFPFSFNDSHSPHDV